MSEVDHLFPQFTSLERKQWQCYQGNLNSTIMVTIPFMLVNGIRNLLDMWALPFREILSFG
jgi:hypothetical protein